MPKKLMVALDGGNREQRDAITYHLNSKGWQIWHWYGDLWLLANVPDQSTPYALWSELNALPPLKGKSMLVSTVENHPLFFGVANPQSWPWMNENWGTPNIPATPAEPVSKPPESPKSTASV
jgi:hypothetical protein